MRKFVVIICACFKEDFFHLNAPQLELTFFLSFSKCNLIALTQSISSIITPHCTLWILSGVVKII